MLWSAELLFRRISTGWRRGLTRISRSSVKGNKKSYLGRNNPTPPYWLGHRENMLNMFHQCVLMVMFSTDAFWAVLARM